MSKMPQSTLGVGQAGSSPWGCRKAALAFLVVLPGDAPEDPKGQEALSSLDEAPWLPRAIRRRNAGLAVPVPHLRLGSPLLHPWRFPGDGLAGGGVMGYNVSRG